MRRLLSLAFLSLALPLTLGGTSARAQSTSDLATYYVGVDTSESVAFGTYLGLGNPNADRLTFLFNHANYENVTSSHYHSIGRWSLTGPVENPTVVGTNGNNRLPESYTGTQLELAEAPAGSPYAGKLISGMPGAGSAADEYGDLEFRMTDSVPMTDGYGEVGEAGTTGLGNAAYYLFNASSQSYVEPVGNLDIELELVGVTPGLAIGDSAGNLLMNEIGDTAPLFDGTDTFAPTFYTEAGANLGVYTASFMLHDRSGAYQSSGTFHFDFTAVPEPSSALLGLVGLTAAVRRHR